MSVRRCVALFALLWTAACAGTGQGSGGTVDGEISVFAAASLSTVFADLASEFEGQSGVEVQLNVAGSSTLREQILAGAPADVFASANEAVMDEVANAGEVNQPQPFATNSMEIGVPAGNPAQLASLTDFADEELLLGACAVGVPCGDAAAEIFVAASIQPELDTSEPDVRSLVTKIAEGELDGGIVYRTDVIANDDLDGVTIGPDENVVVTYPVAPLNRSSNIDAAVEFINFVFSDEGQRILQDHGFGAPGERE